MLVGIREFKSSLSRLLLRAQKGEVIEVTSHSKPIARIVGILQKFEYLAPMVVVDVGALAVVGTDHLLRLVEEGPLARLDTFRYPGRPFRY